MDTYSGFLTASAQTGEANKHMIAQYLKCFLKMIIPKVIEMMIGPDMLVKHFSYFVPNGILNINQIVFIILKDKEL